jgi:putative FmdB family regulatory protein
MPIYAYECSDCGHSKDVLQKLSDQHLVTCPDCGEKGFERKLTAPGFVLKGSGWYVTDFRDGQKKESKEEKPKKKVNENSEKNRESKNSNESQKDPSPTNSSKESNGTKKKIANKAQPKPV